MVLIALSKVAKASSLTFKVLTSLPASALNSVVLAPVNLALSAPSSAKSLLFTR